MIFTASVLIFWVHPHTKGNFIPAVYIELKMFSGRYFGLKYKGM
jgi:hypothetical protein